MMRTLEVKDSGNAQNQGRVLSGGRWRLPRFEMVEGNSAKAQVKCRIRMERLAEMGHELRRPEADLLRNRVHELRATLNGVHYRLLYFFHGNTAAVLTSGIVKEDRVPPVEIERAIARMKSFEANPAKHTYAREQI